MRDTAIHFALTVGISLPRLPSTKPAAVSSGPRSTTGKRCGSKPVGRVIDQKKMIEETFAVREDMVRKSMNWRLAEYHAPSRSQKWNGGVQKWIWEGAEKRC